MSEKVDIRNPYEDWEVRIIRDSRREFGDDYTPTPCQTANYYRDRRQRPLRFLRNGIQCDCQVCKNVHLTWYSLIDYALQWVDVVVGDYLGDVDIDKMMKLADIYHYKGKFVKKMNNLELRNWHLGLYCDGYLEELENDLRIDCREKRKDKKQITEHVLAPYVLDIHRDCIVD